MTATYAYASLFAVIIFIAAVDRLFLHWVDLLTKASVVYFQLFIMRLRMEWGILETRLNRRRHMKMAKELLDELHNNDHST